MSVRFIQGDCQRHSADVGSGQLGLRRDKPAVLGPAGLWRRGDKSGLNRRLSNMWRPCAACFAKCSDCLKPTGTGWLNLGDCYAKRERGWCK